MKVQALWYGGCNYAAPTQDDIETFDSLAHAKRVFQARLDNDSGRFPCVESDESEMHVYFHEYTENGPDRIIRSGHRGGVIVERC